MEGAEGHFRPVVVAGPSGVGKSTNITRLMKDHPGKFGFSVSHTTRKPRPGETNGVQYHFVTEEEFLAEVGRGAFVEWAVFAGHHYGTTIDAVNSLKARGQVAILDIDIQGVKSLKALPRERIDPFYMMLVPPSVADLRKRLEGRGDTSPTSMHRRLERAAIELEYAKIDGFFDRVIVSGPIEETYEQFKAAILESQRVKDARM